MRIHRSSSGDLQQLNPYIALTDVLINLVFILLFFAAAILFIGRLGQGDIQYRSSQDTLKKAIEAAFPLPVENSGKRIRRAVWNDKGRNDPPGTQRWVFEGQELFVEGASKLRASHAGQRGGEELILRFANELKLHRNLWRRIRIEGHTVPPPPGIPDDWDLSAERAAAVARLISGPGRIPSYYLSVSARAGQNPIVPLAGRTAAEIKVNERVELIVEFAKQSAAN